MSEPSLRVVIIGSGFIAGEHLNALRQVGGVEIAGVVDVDPARAASFARTAGGIPSSTDLAEALAEWQPHGAVICTPNDSHAALARELAAAGVHALIEKPLAIAPQDAADMAADFQSRGLVLTAAHTHRFSEYGIAIREAIRTGSVGTATHARLTILGGWQWSDWNNWQINRAKSGGHALHNGVHLLDLVTWWLDAEPVEVHALGRREASSELDIHDYLLMSVRYADGQTAVAEMSRANRPRDLNYREAFIQGTAASLHLPWTGETPLLLGSGGISRAPGTSPFADQARAWVDAVRGRRESAVTGQDGLRAVLLGAAAERSLATGRPIEIAELTGEISHA